jgi:ATP-dependent RNA helicase DOB1
MYNSKTSEKIKSIPPVGNINIDRLPQELTRIYAQIVSFRRQFQDGILDIRNTDFFKKSLTTLQTLANNLETLILTKPLQEEKEAIAFVAATAHHLIYKMTSGYYNEQHKNLEVDSISPLISAVILFLIGNSQPDAAEISKEILVSNTSTEINEKLVIYIKALAVGKLSLIIDNTPLEEDISSNNIQELALEYLWLELAKGVFQLGVKLSKPKPDIENDINHFDKVINLSISEQPLFNQRSVYSGPLHLAKLLKILEEDILERSIVKIPPPENVDAKTWGDFLIKVSLERPYLWQNHFEATETNFLNQGVSSILTLPTGAGKSTLSELKIASSLFLGKNIIYLVPTHALEHQVSSNLTKLFDSFVPNYFELDGEYSEITIPISSILVMTPERCLTLLNVNPVLFANIGLVVFDEFHLIHGVNITKDRRAFDAMYCLLSLFSIIPNSDYLLISAMVENGEEIKNWISQITSRECILFNSSWKPTRQLHGCLVYNEDEINDLSDRLDKSQLNLAKKNPSSKLKREIKAVPYSIFSLKNIWETKNSQDYYISKILETPTLLGVSKFWKITSNRNKVAVELVKYYANLGLKTLVFVNTPRFAESVAKELHGSINRKNIFKAFSEQNKGAIFSLSQELGGEKYSYLLNGENIGIHHGLLLPEERNFIEAYFKQKEGSIALIATATLAQGINLPAEIVIIAGDDRFSETSETMEPIPPHELLNAAGRAGRAGQSSQGAVILIPGKIVTIKGLTISNRWWDLKRKVFSKSDQCLKIEDPLEYFLDSIQDTSIQLDIIQTNAIYRFKSNNGIETKNFLKNSFYAYKASQTNKLETFENHIESLIFHRNKLDSLSEEMIWVNEISFKTGIDPSVIESLSIYIDNKGIDFYNNQSIPAFIEDFFEWLNTASHLFYKVFTKKSTVNHIKRAVGQKPENNNINELILKLPKLSKLFLKYITGENLENIEIAIVGKASGFLPNARNFVIRLVPEMSFLFGLFTMVIIEKAEQEGYLKEDLSLNIRVLASCIREGFDEPKKLFFKFDNKITSRVEAHLIYNNQL